MKIATQKLDSHSNEAVLKCESFPPGMYILDIHADGRRVASTKLVIAR